MNLSRFLVPFLALVLGSGCGTLLTPGMMDVHLSSTPDSADVYVGAASLGVTPLTVEVSNRESHLFTFQKEGYLNESCLLDTRINMWAWVGDAALVVPLWYGGLVVGILLYDALSIPVTSEGLALSISLVGTFGFVPMLIDRGMGSFRKLKTTSCHVRMASEP